MATLLQIKQWIREIRTVRPISESAILVRPDALLSKDAVLITLLDTACCVPAIRIPKPIEAIERSDIEQHSILLNHSH